MTELRLFSWPGAVPATFPSPFDPAGPAPIARAAADALSAHLRAGWIAPGLPTSILEAPGGGKMFGVLVVATPEGLAALWAFSGQLAGRWRWPGFAPPLFDAEARARVEPRGEALVKRLLAQADTLRGGDALDRARVELTVLERRLAAESARTNAEWSAARAARHAERLVLQQIPDPTDAHRARLAALDQASRADKAERRALNAAHRDALDAHRRPIERAEARLRTLDRRRQRLCRLLNARIHDTYQVTNTLGDVRPLRDLYPGGQPPSGAGDCAAPKLLARAFALGLRPIALAELWWGAPPPTGGRETGALYPACPNKCGPLLPHLLAGLPQDPPEAIGTGLNIVHQDETLVVIDKPAGLLSVPGRGAEHADSVLTRLRALYPEATGPLLVHRLDQDTSGLLIAALTAPAHAHLQRQFRDRTVIKRYIAWVEGTGLPEQGEITLALRPDPSDRPRQLHDPAHGKTARTSFQVQTRADDRTRVLLTPHTGRTHQLRVHAAHPAGLDAPILGDRLYGRPGPRLHLHAESITIQHPEHNTPITFRSPAPF